MAKKHGYVDSTRPIVILDSGLGGAIVEKRFKEKYPHENTVLLIDNAFMPYGTKDKREVRNRIKKVMRKVEELEPKALIIACNTIDSLAMDVIFTTYPDMPTVQIVAPTSKKAVDVSKSKSIAVLATPNTIESQSYLFNSALYYPNTNVIGVACDELASAIENNTNIKETFNLETAGLKNEKFDTIVLGCTHYAKVRPLIKKTFGDVNVIDSTEVVVEAFETILNRIILQPANKIGATEVLYTGDVDMDYLKKLYSSIEPVKISLDPAPKVKIEDQVEDIINTIISE